ncbi:MAG: hypothetical protein E7409_00250 [Ruminococcaceae bacterium]|nr:hypothetical protein [Oscillospiraceae bacterium]
MKNITLEMSLKPFKQTDEAYIEKVCERLFTHWEPLSKAAECVSVMLWAADGSELLDYRGDIEAPFEWCYHIGDGSPMEWEPNEKDPEGISLISGSYSYMKNPPKMTYAILKQIIQTIKRVGREVLGDKIIRVGTTVDPGPEFAYSEFKYVRHTELCGDEGAEAARGFICVFSNLKGDDISYAAFPDGIPDGISFGTFFGRQAQVYMQDMGFDYLWLSNGMGFGMEPWTSTGVVFDGEKFDCSRLDETKAKQTAFWQDFRKECPDYPVETRGTNMSMGIDFASDGVPLKEIYEGGFGILPPPNSPWAAIDGDFGLELIGYMSRCAKLPGKDYLFRYYLHDPWFANSPWYDRYNSQPHDIYLPLSVARLDEEGRVHCPTHMSLLSVDNSFGNLSDACVNEATPHLLKGLKQMPDAPAPVIWVYPFEEYSCAKTEQEVARMYSGDWLIRGAINNGLPLSMVVSTDNFLRHDKSIYAASVLVSAIPVAGSTFEECILSYIKSGGRVIFYGNTIGASKRFCDMIGVTHGEGISGELPVSVRGNYCGMVKHTPLLCGGELLEVARPDAKVMATAGGRPIATYGDGFVWLRGVCSCDLVEGRMLPVPHDRTKYFIAESLFVTALKEFGTEIIYEKPVDQPNPVIMLHRYDNAYLLSAYHPSTSVKTKLRTPLGAPVLDGYETILEDGYATYHFPRAEHRECRVFVEQEGGVVGCAEEPPQSMVYRRRIKVTGLKNATLRLFAENYCKDDFEVVLNTDAVAYIRTQPFEGEIKTKNGLTYYEVRNVTGTLIFSMPFPDATERQALKKRK